MAISDNTTIKVGLLIAGGVVVNKLSDFVDVSAPIILIGSFVVLISMLIYEEHSERSGERSDVANLVKFGLSAVTIGALIGAASLIPLFPSRVFHTEWTGSPQVFGNYELLAAGLISALSALAAARRRSILQLATFLISAMTGMSLLIVSLRPGHDFTSTFIGWVAAGAIVTAIVYWTPEIFRMYRAFWGKNGHPNPSTGRPTDESSNEKEEP
ncbi:hypothetical protein [Herbidospora cretacea]|uniref:hypothetical protein n=1 Tax=Herbidospora cretacea TaxID=28444 RepID=UPI0012F72FD7|nr:hypothetical protein [Herbidospora cretacea]